MSLATHCFTAPEDDLDDPWVAGHTHAGTAAPTGVGPPTDPDGSTSTGRAFVPRFISAFPPPVNAMWSVARCVMVVARSSTAGTRGRFAAVEDLNKAIAALARRGLDVPTLPSNEQLHAMLAAATPVVSRNEGKAIRNYFVTLDYRATHGIYIVLSTGSAKKVDDKFAQPFMARLTAEVAEVRPCLVWAYRLDRVTRNAWAFGQPMLVLSEIGAYIGDMRRGIRSATGSEAVLVFFDAWASEDEAEKMPHKTRQGMVMKSDLELVSGCGHFYVNVTPPPGFTTVRVTTRSRSPKGDRFLVLDSPQHLPQAAQMLTPGVHVGQADQVENVRWLLQHLGRPGWSVEKLAAQLAARGFSHGTLRRWQGADAVVKKERRFGAFQAIVNNLAVYETGQWTVRLGISTIDDPVLSGLVPPDGPWATAADFARIRRFLRARARRETQRTKLVLGGHPVTFDGAEFALRTAPGTPGKYVRPHAYCLVDRFSRIRVPGTPVLDAAGLSGVIAESIAAAGDAAVPLAEVDLTPDAQQLAATHDAQLIEVEVGVQESRLQDLQQQSSALISSGVTGALLRDVAQQYDQLDQVVLPEIRRRLADANALVTQLRRARIRKRPELVADALLQLVATLSDPHDQTMRPTLRQSLSTLVVTVAPVEHQGPKSLRCTISGVLAVASGPDDLLIEISGSWLQGPVATRSETVERSVARLAAGIPLAEQPLPRRVVWHALIAERLGMGIGAAADMHCRDPRILRVLTRLHLSSHLPLDEVARILGEPVDFVHRVAVVSAARRDLRWCRPGGVRIRTLMASARANDGWLRYADQPGDPVKAKTALQALASEFRDLFDTHPGIGYRMRPCSWCGVRALAVPRIDEPVGAVCRACRRDQAGFEWPAEPYDQYLQ